MRLVLIKVNIKAHVQCAYCTFSYNNKIITTERWWMDDSVDLEKKKGNTKWWDRARKEWIVHRKYENREIAIQCDIQTSL